MELLYFTPVRNAKKCRRKVTKMIYLYEPVPFYVSSENDRCMHIFLETQFLVTKILSYILVIFKVQTFATLTQLNFMKQQNSNSVNIKILNYFINAYTHEHIMFISFMNQMIHKRINRI